MSVVIDTGMIKIKSNGEWIPMPHIAPQVGVDFFTDADKEEIVNRVIEAIPTDEWKIETGGETVTRNVMVRDND